MSDLFSRLATALEGRYELLRELGAGGMATVFLARDVRHNRQVALKVLHPELSAVLGPERFLKEIELTASLQHPHILPLFDSGEAGGQLFYVMPFVDGETLRGRLDRETQLPIADALTLAREVADALQYAHDRGVIHRDIKPENILLQGGHALVADFGIALAVQQAGTRMTQTGLSLGTPQYMAPEQAMGERTIDARADVYALGAVTYEMLTGEPPFTGSTSQAIVAKLMTSAPLPPTQTRATVPPHVETAVLTALAKLPADRFATVREFRDHLADASSAAPSRVTTAASAAAPRPARSRMAGAFMVIGVLAALGSGYLLGMFTDSTPADGASAQHTYASLTAGPDDSWEVNGDAFAVSPNGRLIAIRSRRDSGTMLVLQSLDSAAARVLPNTGGATYPFFSPDNRSLAFFADGMLRILDLASGTVIARCPAPRPTGGSWGADGVILYVPVSGEALHTTTAVDGPCTRLATKMPAGTGWPRFLSDGRTFVMALGTGTFIGKLGENTLASIANNQARAVVAGDELLYRNGSDGMLVARHINVAKRLLEGPETSILAGVATPFSNTTVAASPTGTVVAYSRPRRRDGSSSMVVHVLPGEQITTAVRNNGGWSVPEASDNGTRVAVGGFNLELFDVARAEWSELVARRPGGGMANAGIAWLPGDSLLAFTRSVNPQVPESILVSNANTGEVQPLAVAPELNRRLQLSRWTRDGRLLAVAMSLGDKAPWDEAWVYDAEAKTFQRAFEETRHVRSPELSPDGKWLAYRVVEVNGRSALFIRPYPGPGVPIPVARGDVDRPRWSRDGRTLYFVRGERRIESVPVAPDGQVGTPTIAVSAATLESVRPDYGMVQFSVGAVSGEFWVLLNEYRTNSLVLLQNLPALLAERRAAGSGK